MSPYKNGTLPQVWRLTLSVLLGASVLGCQLGDNRISGKYKASSFSIETVSATHIYNDATNLIWTDVPGSSGYTVYYREGSEAPGSCASAPGVSEVSVSTNSVDLSGLNPDTQYSLLVCSVGVAAEGSFSLTTLKEVTGTAAYPNNPNWNDYVDRDGSNAFDASDTACSGTGDLLLNLCIHSGEIRKFTAPTMFNDCAGVTAEDSAGAFNWVCDDSSSPVKIYSSGLKADRRLADVLEPNSFKSLRLIIYRNGVATHASSAAVWWNNSVISLPTGNADLDQLGAVYVLNESRTDLGHAITASKISFVTLGEAVYSSGASGLRPNMVGNLWIEGRFGASADTAVIWMALTTHSQIRHLRLEQPSTYGLIVLTGGDYMVYQDIEIDNSSNTGTNFYLSDGDYVHISDLRSNGGDVGVRLSDTQYSLFEKIQISNATTGLRMYGTPSPMYSLFVDTKIAFSGKGMHAGGWRNTFLRTRITHTGRPIHAVSMDETTLIDTIAVNASPSYISSGTRKVTFLNLVHPNGLDDWTAEDMTYVNAVWKTGGPNMIGASVDSYFSQVAISSYFAGGGNGIWFTDNLLLSLAANCTVGSATANHGLDASCNNQGISNANHVTNLNFDNSFVGAVTSDSVNPVVLPNPPDTSDASQVFNFENPYRIWVNDGGGLEIMDFQLKATDTVFRNTTNDGENQNQPFVAGATCPMAVNGNYTMTDQHSAPNTFLVNAQEIFFDGVGDDDGLCESNEACIYSPNFGVYQGHGDYLANGTCNFQNGTVTGVQMYAYPSNGT